MYQDAYLETEVLSASPVQLVSMLYRAALQSLRDALLALERGDIAERSRRLSHAEAILGELTVSLDRAEGGKLSQDLSELYDYMQRRIAQANFEQKAAPIEEVCGLLSTLLEAWTEIAGTPSDAAVPGGGITAAAGRRAYGAGGTGLVNGNVAGRVLPSSGAVWASDEAALDQNPSQFSGVDFEGSRLNSLG